MYLWINLNMWQSTTSIISQHSLRHQCLAQGHFSRVDTFQRTQQLKTGWETRSALAHRAALPLSLRNVERGESYFHPLWPPSLFSLFFPVTALKRDFSNTTAGLTVHRLRGHSCIFAIGNKEISSGRTKGDAIFRSRGEHIEVTWTSFCSPHSLYMTLVM